MLVALVLVGVVGFVGSRLLGGSAGTAADACDRPPSRVLATTTTAAAVSEALGSMASGACPEVRVVTAAAGTAATTVARATTPPLAVVAESVDTASVRAQLGDDAAISKSAVVAATVHVLGLPVPAAEALGWDRQPPSWSEASQVLLNTNAWASQGRSDLGRFNLALADPVSSSATVSAMTNLAATAVHVDPAEVTPAVLSDPRAQGVALALDRAAGTRVETPEKLLATLLDADQRGKLQTISVVFMDEQTVWAYNRTDPSTDLLAVYPTDGVTTDLVSVTTLDGSDASAELTAAVVDRLTGKPGAKAFAANGFRTGDDLTLGVDAMPSGLRADGAANALRPPGVKVLRGMTAGWTQMQNPGRFLVLLDVSGSMADSVPGTGKTKLQFAQSAAVTGMQLVPQATEIGLWEFSTKIDGRRDYRELVSVGPVSERSGGSTRLQNLQRAVNGLQPVDSTGLYDTALAGFRAMQKSYSPGEPNIIILITDGRNEDPGSIGLTALVRRLEADQDPDRPVRIMTLAYGSDADPAALSSISEATGSKAFVAPNPADIGKVFFEALSQR